jgi:hypothetical protein
MARAANIIAAPTNPRQQLSDFYGTPTDRGAATMGRRVDRCSPASSDRPLALVASRPPPQSSRHVIKATWVVTNCAASNCSDGSITPAARAN